LNHLIW